MERKDSVDGMLFFNYNIKPGVTQFFDFSISFPSGIKEAFVGVFVDDEEYIRNQIEIINTATINVPYYRKLLRLSDIVNVLKDLNWHLMNLGETPVAGVKFALFGNDLAVHAFVNDGDITRVRPLWQGSCLEIFTASLRNKKIYQIFLSPAIAGENAVAAYNKNGKEVDISRIKIHSKIVEGGYEISALIPLSFLGLKNQKSFFIEAQTGISGSKSNNVRSYVRLFGSKNPSSDCSRYALLRTYKKC